MVDAHINNESSPLIWKWVPLLAAPALSLRLVLSLYYRELLLKKTFSPNTQSLLSPRSVLLWISLFFSSFFFISFPSFLISAGFIRFQKQAREKKMNCNLILYLFTFPDNVSFFFYSQIYSCLIRHTLHDIRICLARSGPNRRTGNPY